MDVDFVIINPDHHLNENIRNNHVFLPIFNRKYSDLLEAIKQSKYTVQKYSSGFTKKVAIIVPFKNRHQQLIDFLVNMSEFLKKKNLQHKIFIIEQNNEVLFNRGKLLNIGVKESLNVDENFDCFIFHDIDLLPQNLLNDYDCFRSPLHLSSSNIGELYNSYFGGVTSFFKDHFFKVNGFYNDYWGWGVEDDDILARVVKNHLTTYRMNETVGSFKANTLNHYRRKLDPLRYLVNYLYYKLMNGHYKNGYTSVNYNLINMQFNQFYYKILVDI